MSKNPYHFGYDVSKQELILWKTGRHTEVARIPLSNALSLAETLVHVSAVEHGEEN